MLLSYMLDTLIAGTRGQRDTAMGSRRFGGAVPDTPRSFDVLSRKCALFRYTGKLHKERPTRQDFEREAALILERRIAEGRPPPEVWRKAAEWRARKGRAAGWYTPEPGRPASRSEQPRLVPTGEPFVLRVVRFPAPTTTTSRSGADESRPRVVNASTEFRP